MAGAAPQTGDPVPLRPHGRGRRADDRGFAVHPRQRLLPRDGPPARPGAVAGGRGGVDGHRLEPDLCRHRPVDGQDLRAGQPRGGGRAHRKRPGHPGRVRRNNLSHRPQLLPPGGGPVPGAGARPAGAHPPVASQAPAADHRGGAVRRPAAGRPSRARTGHPLHHDRRRVPRRARGVGGAGDARQARLSAQLPLAAARTGLSHDPADRRTRADWRGHLPGPAGVRHPPLQSRPAGPGTGGRICGPHGRRPVRRLLPGPGHRLRLPEQRLLPHARPGARGPDLRGHRLSVAATAARGVRLCASRRPGRADPAERAAGRGARTLAGGARLGQRLARGCGPAREIHHPAQRTVTPARGQRRADSLAPRGRVDSADAPAARRRDQRGHRCRRPTRALCPAAPAVPLRHRPAGGGRLVPGPRPAGL